MLAAIAAVTVSPQPARAMVRIVRSQRIDKNAWEKHGRPREIARTENGRRVKIRLIEFE